MKLTDYVAAFLQKEGVRHVFGLTGGAVVHLFDSVARTPGLQAVFNHHEQAGAFAAEAYAKVSNGLGAAFFTTGPGGTNALTGLSAAWLDSIPCIYVSGQARIEHCSRGKNIRQLGTQEFDIVSVVSGITKYAVMVEDPRMIRYHLEKAVHLARTGRPGPVWIDIPLNFQWASIEPDQLPSFQTESTDPVTLSGKSLEDSVEASVRLLKEAKRPVILIGYGLRLAHGEGEFKNLIETLKIPFLSSWNACDIVPTHHPLYVGRPGIAGQRGANLAIQNCDLLLSVGSHLCIPQTGTMYNAFARAAKKIIVDVDGHELKKDTIRIELAVQADGRVFLEELLKRIGNLPLMDIGWWRGKCLKYKTYNAIPTVWRAQKNDVNPYVFIDTLSDELGNDDLIVVDGGGTNVYASFQALKVKEGQRVVLSSGLAAMGSGLPESIGACFARGRKRTVCLCGDGSMQLNIQELQTILHHNLPVKIFVFNNGGYLSIRGTQNEFLEGRRFGSEAEGGMSLPDFVKVAEAYGMKTSRITSHSELQQKIRHVLEIPGSILCEIMVSRNQEVIPRQGFISKPDGTFAPRPLEDMYPYLDREEFLENMVVDPLG